MTTKIVLIGIKRIGVMMSDYSIMKPMFIEHPLSNDNHKAKGPYKIFKEEIFDLGGKGWSAWQIARKMNISRRSVQKVLREQG